MCLGTCAHMPVFSGAQQKASWQKRFLVNKNRLKTNFSNSFTKFKPSVLFPDIRFWSLVLYHWSVYQITRHCTRLLSIVFYYIRKVSLCYTIDTFDTFSTIRSYTSGAASAPAHSPAPGRLLPDQYTHLLKNNIVVFLRRSPIQVLTQLIVA